MTTQYDSMKERIASLMTKIIADNGTLLENGAAIYLAVARTPPQQYADTRLAFLAGCEHTFSSMMNVVSEGDDITADDERIMSLIGEEIEMIRAELRRRLK